VVRKADREGAQMTIKETEPAIGDKVASTGPARPPDADLVRRALDAVESGTTDMADDVLRISLAYYRSPELAARERSEILFRTPLALVPTARVVEPNDFVVRNVLGLSVLVSRGDDGVARAFLNYCRHRGAQPAAGSGSARRHACPYHSWTYDSAGRLVGIPGREGFTGIDPADHGLVELPSEERHGFCWVVLTAGATFDLSAHLGPLDAELATWDYANYGYLTERVFESKVNWKSALEAFGESYHFPYVHGTSVIGQNTVANTSVHDAFGMHHRLGFPFNWITGVREKPESQWVASENMGLIYWVFPNLVLANSPVGVEIIDILPGEDAGSCVVSHGWMGRTPPAEMTDDLLATYEGVYEQVHYAIREEDFTMLPSCGEGIQKGAHDHMVVGRNEIGVQHTIRTLCHRLGIDPGWTDESP